MYDSGDKKIIALKIKNYLDEMFRTNITNQLLAARFGFVPSYIVSIFKTYYGLTPMDYLVKTRIDESKFLLANSSVTCSRHLNLTDFEVGASCSIALQDKAKTGYPRVSRGSFFIRLWIFSVLLCTFFIYSFSFFQNIDRRIHIPVHPVSTFA